MQISYTQHQIIIKIKRIIIKYDYISFSLITISSILFYRTFSSCILCAVIHEAGHAVMLLHYGCDTLEIKLRLLCLDMIDKGRMKRSPAEHVLCILAGPLFNIISIPVFYAVYKFFDTDFALSCIKSSLALGIFNMLPLQSTDGGELLTILLERIIQPKAVQRVVNVITALFISAIILVLIYQH